MVWKAMFATLALVLAQCEPVGAQECVTPDEHATLAMEAGVTQYRDHGFANDRIVRIYTHEDHFDAFLFISGCRTAGSALGLDSDDVAKLLAAVGERSE